MNKGIIKFISVAMISMLSSTSFAACSKKADVSQKDVKSTAGQSATVQSTEVQYPIKTDVKLKYWMELHVNVATLVKNFGETEVAKELQKRTGITVEYLHPAAGQTKEVLNLMIASGDLPDIIEYPWINFPGGPNNALKNQAILKLNDTIDKYAPNLKDLLKANSNIDKMVKTDEGSYYVFPFLRGTTMDNNGLLTSSGLMVRKDWLDELGMKVPETAEEWYNVLKAFKEKKDASAPFTIRGEHMNDDFSPISPGFDNIRGFYVEDGKIKYGGIEPNRRTYLTEMNKWYKEGLLDKNFATTDTKTQDSNMLNNKSGATYAPGGGGMGKWLQAMASKEPKFDLAAAAPVTSKKGQPAKFGKMNNVYDGSGASAAISTKSKNIEIAARFLDYNYSKEGKMLLNFGVEGVTYKMENGYPKYTDYILKNPQGWDITKAMSNYLRGHISGPLVQDIKEMEQYYQMPQQKDALVQWSKSSMGKHIVPPITPTDAESAEISKIMADITTYMQEMETKLIMGTEPLSKSDAVIEQVKKLGIDKVLKLKQDQLDRYNKR
jgi:putative aldouronate transport system substrate-binding protein